MTDNKRSGFEGGLWVIPVAALLGAIYCAFRSFKNPSGFVSAPTTVFVVLLLIVAIGSAWWMRSER